MSAPRPGVYVGTVTHQRRAPLRHGFSYPLFMVLLDVDRIPELMRASWLTGYNRWRWASFHEADHFGDPSLPLRDRLGIDAAAHGFTVPDGPIFLLTHLRYLGYCFNPVSFFYCYDAASQLRLVLAEVHNTFGGSHNYWLEPDASAPDAASPVPRARAPRVYRAAAAKGFYVSPFMPPDLAYAFALSEPGDVLSVDMEVESRDGQETGHAFGASLRLRFRPWTSAALVRALARFPVMTANVVAGIHWQAMKLWWKGLPIVPRPTRTGEYQDGAAPGSVVAVSKR